jgi:hypothetical protein
MDCLEYISTWGLSTFPEHDTPFVCLNEIVTFIATTCLSFIRMIVKQMGEAGLYRFGHFLAAVVVEPIALIQSAYFSIFGDEISQESLKAQGDNKNVIVLLHGNLLTEKSFAHWIAPIRASGFKGEIVLPSIGNYGDEVQSSTVMSRIGSSLIKKNVTVVGYSRGAEVGAEFFDGLICKSKRLVCIGTPYRGRERATENILEMSAFFEEYVSTPSVLPKEKQLWFRVGHIGLLYSQEVLDKVTNYVMSTLSNYEASKGFFGSLFAFFSCSGESSVGERRRTPSFTPTDCPGGSLPPLVPIVQTGSLPTGLPQIPFCPGPTLPGINRPANGGTRNPSNHMLLLGAGLINDQEDTDHEGPSSCIQSFLSCLKKCLPCPF